MKRKLTSIILTIALAFAVSAPALAASNRAGVSGLCGSEQLYQLLCRYIGCCDGGMAIRPPAQPRDSAAQPETPAQPQEDVSQPETPAQPQEDAAADAFEQEVVRLVNEERAKRGLAALTRDAALTRTARIKSQDMHDNRYFGHESPTYGTPFQLMKSQGIRYRTAGENIAMGYATAAAVVGAWMNSPGHRANILNASYTRIGVGYVADGSYWTQHFAG